MKKLLLITAIALASLKVSAQTEQGTIMAGGAVNFSTSKSDADGAESSDSFTILPMMGYFIQNNVAIGTGIGYSHSKNAGGKSGTFIVNPFARAYKGLGSEQFKFFGQLSVPLSFENSEDDDGNDTGSETSIGVALSPGFAFFPTKKFAIELTFSGIQFQNTKVEDGAGNKVDGSSGNSFSIGANFFSPDLGFVFHF